MKNINMVKLKWIKESKIKQATKELIEEADIDEEVESALSSTKKPFQRLGQGIIGDKFYYGTSLLWHGKPISALITSEKKVYLGLNYIDWKCSSCNFTIQTIQPSYEIPKPPKDCSCSKASYRDFQIEQITNPIKDELGVNYRTEFNDESIDYSWQTESIKNYINNNYKKYKLEEIFNKIVSINKKYTDHLNLASHSYITCWIIATYCYALFEQFGRLYFRAERGSGKTKQCRIIKFLSHNPMWITKGTESSIFRDAEATCGTFIVDNMDKLHEDLLKAMEHHIETGWMWDATYRLTNKDTGKTQKFLSYTPMGLNNIYGLDEDTIDKTFEITMLKSINPEIQKTKPTNKSEQWQEISDSIRFWVLNNSDKIKEIYNNITSKFSGREYDVVEGVLTIAKLVSDEVYHEIESLVEEKIKEQFVNLENNPSYIIFNDIWEQFLENSLIEERNVFIGELADKLFLPLNPDLQPGTKEYTNKKKGCSKYIAKLIRAVPMFRKSGIIHGKTWIKIKKKDLERYMKLQKFLKYDDVNEPSNLPTSPTSTKSTKLPTSPFNKNNTKLGGLGDVDIQKKEELGDVGSLGGLGDVVDEVDEELKEEYENDENL